MSSTRVQFVRGYRVVVSRYGTSPPKLLRPFLFATTVSTGAFVTAAFLQARDAENQIPFSWKNRAQQRRSESEILHTIRGWLANFGLTNNTVNVIIAANTAVFLMWRIPALSGFMQRFFVYNTTSRRVLPMLLSGLSHVTPLHFAFNMLALSSFGPLLCNVLGDHQFVALCCSSAVLGSLAITLHARFAAPFHVLGFSGALMGLLGAATVYFPDSGVQLFFLPFLQTTLFNAMIGMAAVDTVGVLAGWRMFGHAAHLGGLAFGVAYAYVLQPYYGQMRRWFRQQIRMHRV